MATYKLSYFAITGLGEPLRASMALAGIKFEEEILTGEQWGKIKSDSSSPLFGKQLPALWITDESGASQCLSQSRAILRYIGKIGQFNGKPLYPADPMAQYYCDEVIEMVEDIRPLMVPTFGIADQAEKEAARAALVAPDGKMTPHFVKLNERLGKFAFAAGPDPSIADVYTVCVCYMFQAPSFVDGFPADTFKAYPNLVALKDRLMALPPLAEYYKDAEGIRAPFKVA